MISGRGDVLTNGACLAASLPLVAPRCPSLSGCRVSGPHDAPSVALPGQFAINVAAETWKKNIGLVLWNVI